MKKIFSAFVILLFIFYWICTILFTMPDNYVNISFLEYHATFERFFFQRWGFFAPPPQYNDYLYYTYYPQGTDSLDIKTFEVLGSIIEEKQKNAPFNSSEERLDYVFSSAISSMTEEANALKIMTKKDSSKNNILSSLASEQVEKGYSFTVLKNYAKLVAEKNSIDTKRHKFQISVIQRAIRKFSERNNTNYVPPPAELLFRSSISFF